MTDDIPDVIGTDGHTTIILKGPAMLETAHARAINQYMDNYPSMDYPQADKHAKRQYKHYARKVIRDYLPSASQTMVNSLADSMFNIYYGHYHTEVTQ